MQAKLVGIEGELCDSLACEGQQANSRDCQGISTSGCNLLPHLNMVHKRLAAMAPQLPAVTAETPLTFESEDGFDSWALRSDSLDSKSAKLPLAPLPTVLTAEPPAVGDANEREGAAASMPVPPKELLLPPRELFVSEICSTEDTYSKRGA